MSKRLVNKINTKDPNSISINSNDIIKKIHEGYEAQSKIKDGVRVRKGFTASGLTYGAGHCPRMWYLWFEGNEAKSNNDWYSVANMDSGNDRHTRIQDAMDTAGILITKEAILKNEDPVISMRTDAIIKWEDQEILTEIKTMSEDSFQRAYKPRKYHVEQLLIYMRVMKKTFAYLIYESKNSHEMKFFDIHINQKYKDFTNYLWDWMKKVQKAFDDQTLPENPYRNKYNSKVCKSCDFFEACQTKPEGVIKIEARKELE